MSDFAALAYLEGRQIANTVMDIARKPQRLLLYLFVVLYFAFLIWTRTLGHPRPMTGVEDPWATLIGLGMILIAALAVGRAAGGHVAAFSSMAEARFLIGSRMSERNVAVWLQLRNSARTLLRLLFLIVLYAILFHGAGGPLAIALAMTCAIIAGIALCIPVFKLSRRIGKRPCYMAAAVIGAIAVAGAAVVGWAYLGAHPHGLRREIAVWGPGNIVHQALLGNPVVLGIGFAIDAILIGLAYFGASDIYPELNAGSTRYIQAMARAQRGGAFAGVGRSANASTTVRSVSVPSGFTGAYAMLWKAWLSFRRATVSVVTFWVMLGGAVVAGAVLGVVGKHGDDGLAFSIAFGAIFGFAILFVGALFSAVSLAGDLGKPIWWLSKSTLRERLYAWTAATGWSSAVCAIAGVIVWAAFLRMPIIAFVGIPAAIILALFSRAIGLALYSIFPSSLDQRGPAAFGRMLGLYASLVPPVGLGLAGGLLSSSLIVGIAIATTAIVVELLAMIEFAAWRIRRHGIAIAQAEST